MQIEMNYGGPSMPMEYAQGELTQEKAIEAPINKSHKKKKSKHPVEEAPKKVKLLTSRITKVHLILRCRNVISCRTHNNFMLAFVFFIGCQGGKERDSSSTNGSGVPRLP